jgi:hypothetical protein
MPFKLPDGRLIAPDVAFTLREIQYPANFLRLSTEEEKTALGIEWVSPAPDWDQRFYWGYDTEGALIPKDHAQLVEQWVAQTRIIAGTLIQPTDWMVIREQDNGTVVPESVKALREDIRLATGQKNAAIEATADTAELAAYITGTEYPVWPSDPPAAVESVAIDGLELAFNGGATGGAIL